MSTDRRIRRFMRVISDTYAFVQSQEANKAISSVTLEQLVSEQIKRNGDPVDSRVNTYTPYSFDPAESGAASELGLQRANFIGGADINQGTRFDRLVQLRRELDSTIDQIQKIDPSEFFDSARRSATSVDPITTASDPVVDFRGTVEVSSG